MTTPRYAVFDVPTTGANKGKITKVWDFDLTKSDAELLKKRIANKRLSKWPVVLDQDQAKAHPHLDEPSEPTAEQMAALGIDPKKFAGMSPEDEEKLVTGLAGELGAVLDPLVAAGAAGATNADVAKLIADDPTEISIAPGYMGVAAQWCWWESEYPEDGMFGPYDSEAAVRAAVAKNYTQGGMKFTIVHVYTEEEFRATFTRGVLPTPEHTVGPPPGGRTVDEHLDELIRNDYAADALQGVVVTTGGDEIKATATFSGGIPGDTPVNER